MRTHLAVVVFAVTALVAQDDLPRQRLFGVALRADRAPWVGAKVHACAAGPRSLPDGQADLVHATTDARGRFHLEVLRGRVYAVWAEQELADDMALVSAQAVNGWAGERVELAAMAEPVAAPRLVLRELPRDLELPLRAEVHSWTTGLVETIAIDTIEDGGASRLLTPVPPGSCFAFVRDARGSPVLAASDAKIDSLALRPAPPRWLRIRVEDLESKAGIAGAEILAIVQGRPVALGRTDGGGIAVIDVGRIEARVGDADARATSARFITSARGYGLGWMDLRKFAGQSTREAALAAAEPDAVVRPARDDAPRRRIRLLAGGTVLAGARIQTSVSAVNQTDRGSSTGTVVELALTTNENGIVELPIAATTTAVVSAFVRGTAGVTLVLDPPQLRVLPERWREGLPSAVPITLPAANAAGDAAPVGVDLLTMIRPVDVELVASDGVTPAAGADVHCGPLGASIVAALRCDRVGRVRVLVPTAVAGRIAIAAIGEAGWCAHEFDPGHAPDDVNRIARFQARLVAPLRIEVVIAPGRLTRLPESLQVSHTLSPPIAASTAATASRPDPGSMPRFAPLDPTRQVVLLQALGRQRAVTGDRVTIFAPSIPARMTIYVTGQLDGQPVRTSGAFGFDGSEGRVTFELAFDK